MQADSRAATVGILHSLTASVVFAAIYYYTSFLTFLDGEAVYAWRVLLTIPCVGLMLAMSGGRRDLLEILARLRSSPMLWVALPASSMMLGVQLWLFVWAPVNGYGLDVSLGYFLLPLALVVTGRVLYGERITRLQTVACCFAGIGVLNALYFAQSLSWPALMVAGGYPFYYALRRATGTANIAGMWIDMMLSLPVVIWFVMSSTTGQGQTPPSHLAMALLIVGFGALSAIALACHFSASQKLTMGLFGLLTYIEPVLLVLISLLLGESIAPADISTFVCIWTALLVLVFGKRDFLRTFCH